MKKYIMLLLLAMAICANANITFSDEMTREQVDDLMRRAGKYYENTEYAEAIRCYRLAADHGNAWGQNNLAWILATFEDAHYRDGKAAVEYALKATAQEPRNAHFFRTLAAAYARNGQFDPAVTAQKNAIALLSEDTLFSEEVKAQLRVDHREKLALYEQRHAYVDKR